MESPRPSRAINGRELKPVPRGEACRASVIAWLRSVVFRFVESAESMCLYCNTKKENNEYPITHSATDKNNAFWLVAPQSDANASTVPADHIVERNDHRV